MLDAITYNFRLAPPRSPPQMPVSFDAGRAALAKSLYRERRIRDELLPCDLFAEPAWDMLLDLYGAHYRRAKVSVSSLCIAACVPGTTALRWIKTMEDAGLFTRQCDPIDKRRIFIWLSEGARLAMDAYFDKLAQVRGQA
jgi:DNA-binding MarR family transcriptional regulator